MAPEQIIGKLKAALELIEVQDRLIGCYRAGTSPSGATWDRIRQLRAEIPEEAALEKLGSI